MPESPEQTDVFVSGTDGYHTYRIPALLTTRAGTVLAFCEGRRHHGGDHGEIALLVKRSEDDGHTWSEQEVVWEDTPNTCGNPCPVQDSSTGVIWLTANWNRPGGSSYDYFNALDTRYVFVLASEDDGRTWSPPRDITSDVKRPNWGWYATGPCTGIELMTGPSQGRLLIPCNHTEFDESSARLYSHVIYSDDHGESWHLGGRTPTDMLDECQAAELSDGRVMLNMRNADRAQDRRAVSISEDGGLTWGPVRHDPALPEPMVGSLGCQGSLIRAADGRLFFSNPASTHREHLTVRMSPDDGATWPVARVLHEGPAAYSSLAALPGDRIACLYERGQSQVYERITFADWSIVGESCKSRDVKPGLSSR